MTPLAVTELIVSDINVPKQQVETAFETSQPIVLRGGATSLPAYRTWGTSAVEAGQRWCELGAAARTAHVMRSTSGPSFYGDMRRHEPYPLTVLEYHRTARSSTCTSESGVHLYLAQTPILKILPPRHEEADDGDEDQLTELLEDILPLPEFLPSRVLDAVATACSPPNKGEGTTTTRVEINLWSSLGTTSSSLHHDPFDNALFVLSGTKTVLLFPPKASWLLAQQSVSSESANHSLMDLTRTDEELVRQFPMWLEARALALEARIGPGDVLCIPEGWWHHVSSSANTVAINVWWESTCGRMLASSAGVASHTLRRCVQQLAYHWRQQVLADIPEDPTTVKLKAAAHISKDSLEEAVVSRLETISQQYGTQVDVHTIKTKKKRRFDEGRSEPLEEESNHQNSDSLGADGGGSFAAVMQALSAQELRGSLLRMATLMPGRLERLVMNASPLAMEMLTQKFEEADRIEAHRRGVHRDSKTYQKTYGTPQDEVHGFWVAAENHGQSFYDGFYGAFRSVKEVFDRMLDMKEQFAMESVEAVLTRELGVNLGFRV